MDIEVKNLNYGTSFLMSTSGNDIVIEYPDFGAAIANQLQSADIKGYGTTVNGTTFSPRGISIIGWVIASDIMSVDEKKKPLRRIINPLHQLELIIDGTYSIKGRADTSIKFANRMDRRNNEVLCRFVIDITAHYPFFTYAIPEVITESQEVGVPLFPITIPENEGMIFGLIPENNLSYILNEGDIETGFLFEITAYYGDVTEFILTSTTLNQSIKLLGYKLEKDNKILISTLTGDKYIKLITDTGEEDITNKMSLDSKMFQLIPGANNLTLISGDSSNLRLKMTRSPAFMEVIG